MSKTLKWIIGILLLVDHGTGRAKGYRHYW